MAGDSAIRYKSGPIKPPFGYGTQPAMPAPMPMTPGGFSTAPPPALGGPEQMGGQFAAPGQIGQPAMTPPGGQMTPAGGQPPQGQPQFNDDDDDYKDTVAALFNDDPHAIASDSRFDQFIDNEMAVAQGEQAPQEHVGFIQGLKNAKRRDPVAFWLTLGAIGSGDPERMREIAMYMRKEKQTRQREARANVIAYGQRRQQQAARQETRNFQQQGREDTQAHQREQLRQREIDRDLNRWDKDKTLHRIEDRLGRPVSTYDDLKEARIISSQIGDEDKFVKTKSDYVKSVLAGPSPTPARIKQEMEADPEYAAIVEEANKSRKENDELDKEYKKARTNHMTRVAAMAAKLDPATRLRVMNLNTKWAKAHDDAKSFSLEARNRKLLAKADTQGTLGEAENYSIVMDKAEEAEQAAQDIDDVLNEMLSELGAPDVPSFKRAPEPTNGDARPTPSKSLSKTKALLGMK